MKDTDQTGASPVAELKKRIRGEERRRRKAADKSGEGSLTDFFTRSPLFSMAKKLMVTVSLKDELDTQGIIEEAIKSGKELYLPVCLTREVRMLPVRLRDYPGGLTPGAFGIPEPADRSEQLCDLDRLDIVVVPGLVFSRDFWRLGQGGGYYDRFLPRTKALRVALTTEAQLRDSLPVEPTDQMVDVIITERLTRLNPNPESRRRLKVLTGM